MLDSIEWRMYAIQRNWAVCRHRCRHCCRRCRTTNSWMNLLKFNQWISLQALFTCFPSAHISIGSIFRNQLKICQSVRFVLLFHTFSNSSRLICADIQFLSTKNTKNEWKKVWTEIVRKRERENEMGQKRNWNARSHGNQIRTHLCSTYLLILLTFVRNLTLAIRKVYSFAI